MKQKSKLLVLILIVAVFLQIGAVSAQQQLIDGTVLTATSNAQAPQQIYVINAVAGQEVMVYAIPSFGLQINMTMLGAGGETLNATDAAVTPIQNDVLLTYRVPTSGDYTLIIGSTNNAEGTYVLSMRVIDPAPNPLLPAQPVAVSTDANTQEQFFSIAMNPAGVTQLLVEELAPDTGYVVRLWNETGELIGFIKDLDRSTFDIPAGTGTYMVSVVGTVEGTFSNIQLSLGTGSVSGGSANPPAVAPQATEEVTSGGSSGSGQGTSPPANICTVTPNGSVNVRVAPSTDSSTLGTLILPNYAEVIGQNNGWWQINFNGVVGWVAQGVVRINGPCDNVPFADAPGSGSSNPAPPATTQEVAPPAQPTAIPAQPTAVPAQPTVAPPATTQEVAPPAQPTAVPAQPTAVPAQPTAVPAQPTVAPPATTEEVVVPTGVPLTVGAPPVVTEEVVVPTNAPPTATYTVEAPPTATYTVEAPPTATYTPTATEEVVEEPYEETFNYAIDRDTPGQFSNTVEGPNGNTSDRIFFEIDNLTNFSPNSFRRVTHTFICIGTGTEHVTFTVLGNRGTANCGETIGPLAHTNDSYRDTIVVEVAAGQTADVNYTISSIPTQ